MGKQKNSIVVQDYHKFTRELRAQLNVLKVLEREFYGLDDLCEWSIRNDVTCLNEGMDDRINVVDDCLGEQQRNVYKRMMREVAVLGDMLSAGLRCFMEA